MRMILPSENVLNNKQAPPGSHTLSISQFGNCTAA
jgi:hypothetical protein